MLPFELTIQDWLLKMKSKILKKTGVTFLSLRILNSLVKSFADIYGTAVHCLLFLL